jgi:hypothetical protein
MTGIGGIFLAVIIAPRPQQLTRPPLVAGLTRGIAALYARSIAQQFAEWFKVLPFLQRINSPKLVAFLVIVKHGQCATQPCT